MRTVSISRLTSIIRRPDFWLLAILLLAITIFHYGESLGHPIFLTRLAETLGISRHAFERIAYLIPIIWSGFLFGWKGSLITSLIALTCMLPRAIFISSAPRDALFETGAVFLVGNLVAFTFVSLRKEREYRIQLAAINRIAGAVSQSLELNQILNSSIDNIMNVMKADATYIYLLDKKTGELTLVSDKRTSEQFAQPADKLRIGEGLNGLVAQTGEAISIPDISRDPRTSEPSVDRKDRGAQLVVPLKSKGAVIGTISVATRDNRRFRRDEIEMLTAIGNQVGVIIENARLYKQSRETVEQLRISEEKYREIFENAHDAMWIHDIDGNIVSANEATSKLTGYQVEELIHMNVRAFLSDEAMRLAKEVRTNLLRGQPVDQPYEQKLTTKNGTEAILKLTTNLVEENDRVIGFQHVARDVTQEKRMQENLRFYLRQVTIAQEEERLRIARELHDETIQALIVLARQLDDIASAGKGSAEDKRLLLENLRQQTNNIVEDVRRLSRDLRPPTLDRLGLIPALEGLASDVQKHSGINVELKIQGVKRRLPVEVELVLFRIVQEALRNVWKHSKASIAEVITEFNEKISNINQRQRQRLQSTGNNGRPGEIWEARFSRDV